MTTLTDTQVITASGGLVELGYAQVTSDVTIYGTAQASPTDIASVVVVSDGSPMVVQFGSYTVYSDTGGSSAQVDLWIDGAVHSVLGRYTNPSSSGTQVMRIPGYFSRRITLSAGSHTIAVRGWKSANGWIIGSGSGSAGAAAPTFISVSKIVQATQWPAVTTGTIICTSTTRPASPFAGQTIYETDSGRKYLYTGSAWISDTPALVLLNSTSVSAQSSVSIDSVFSSTYDNYLVIPRIVGSGSAGLLMRLRSGGADDSSANYSYQHLTGQGTTVSAANSSAQTSWLAGSAYSINTPAQEILIVAPNFAGRTSYKTTFTQDGGSGLFLRTYAGDLATGTQYTGLTIYPQSGTITGAIRVYGYTN